MSSEFGIRSSEFWGDISGKGSAGLPLLLILLGYLNNG